MESFEREDRYLVLKRSDIQELNFNWQTVLERVADEIGAIRMERGKKETVPGIQCVVVEKDWPEYEQVWEMIKKRVESSG